MTFCKMSVSPTRQACFGVAFSALGNFSLKKFATQLLVGCDSEQHRYKIGGPRSKKHENHDFQSVFNIL